VHSCSTTSYVRTSANSLLSRLSSYRSRDTESYPLSLHDALPIYGVPTHLEGCLVRTGTGRSCVTGRGELVGEQAAYLLDDGVVRSEEHTSELQSRFELV